MPPNSDIVRLQHMRDAASEAVSFVQEMGADEFASNRLVQLAVVRSLEIIGEAACHITQPFKDAHPEIPWPQLIGMRHRIVHAYYDINNALVWKTVREALPAFITALETLLSDGLRCDSSAYPADH